MNSVTICICSISKQADFDDIRMTSKVLTAVVILAIFHVSRVNCVPQFQQQGSVAANRPIGFNPAASVLDTTTPVPIVSQSDVKNDDGSFSFRSDYINESFTHIPLLQSIQYPLFVYSNSTAMSRATASSNRVPGLSKRFWCRHYVPMVQLQVSSVRLK